MKSAFIGMPPWILVLLFAAVDYLFAGVDSAWTSSSNKGVCLLPPYIDHGSYTVNGESSPVPGQAFDAFYLNVTCNAGYNMVGDNQVLCVSGIWSKEIPKCVRSCKLNKHESVEYRCLISSSGSPDSTRECDEYELDGTVAIPTCRRPDYHHPDPLPSMHCIEGAWDVQVICKRECGEIIPRTRPLRASEHTRPLEKLPWYVTIYRKTTTSYLLHCAGTLVSNTVVISAAHCYWDHKDNRLLPASQFVAAVGKRNLQWNHPHDTDIQTSNVSEIRVPPRFHGIILNYQDDIAVMKVSTPFQYKTQIKPVCIDFDVTFEKDQLQPGKRGKVGTWGLTRDTIGSGRGELDAIDLAYMDVDKCITDAPVSYREFITSDKICTSPADGTNICVGDSGAGLAFPVMETGTERFYLRGVASSMPTSGNNCNTSSIATFTLISAHEKFVKPYLLH